MADYDMDVWLERDRAVIDVRDAETQQTSVFTLVDDAVQDFIDAGFMKHAEDMHGMTKYLRSVGIFKADDSIVKIT